MPLYSGPSAGAAAPSASVSSSLERSRSPRERRGVDIVRWRQQVGVRELALARRMQDGHLDRPQRAHRRIRVAGHPDRFLDGGIEQLHVPDHQPFAVVIRPLDGRQAIGLGARRGQRLLGQHGKPALEGRERHVAVRPGGEHDQAVELQAVEHRRDIPVPVLGGDPISLAEGRRQRRRQVADRGELERAGEARQEGQVDGLGDGSEARHADTQGPARHPKRRGMGHRSEYTDAHPMPARTRPPAPS